VALLEYLERDCPYYGETCLLAIDMTLAEQDYIEDCPICCRPMRVSVRASDPDQPQVTLRSEDE